jgi:hypothetical protein
VGPRAEKFYFCTHGFKKHPGEEWVLRVEVRTVYFETACVFIQKAFYVSEVILGPPQANTNFPDCTSDTTLWQRHNLESQDTKFVAPEFE